MLRQANGRLGQVITTFSIRHLKQTEFRRLLLLAGRLPVRETATEKAVGQGIGVHNSGATALTRRLLHRM